MCNLLCLNAGSSKQYLSDSPLCPRKSHVLLLRGFLTLFPGSAPEWQSLPWQTLGSDPQELGDRELCHAGMSRSHSDPD